MNLPASPGRHMNDYKMTLLLLLNLPLLLINPCCCY